MGNKVRKSRRRQMPDVRKASKEEKVIGILLGDIHLSLNPPVWRSAEEDWKAAMRRPIQEVRALQYEYDCPIICTGDVFEYWFGAFGRGSPEIINWAINYLPEMYVIPGQHDLPLHKYDDLYRSAYLTLVTSGKVQNILPECCVVLEDMVLHGFPFGCEMKPCPEGVIYDDYKLHVAVVHKYVWIPGHKYPDAPMESFLKKPKFKDEKLYGYDIIVYGDNHKGFLTTRGKTQVFNCGTLMRRKSDEIGYTPQVGLLMKSGKIQQHLLDISQDKYLNPLQMEDIDDTAADMKTFFEELEKLQDTALDFTDAIDRFFQKRKVIDEVKEIILDAMESRKHE